MTERERALSLWQKQRKLEIAKEHAGYVQCPYCRLMLPVEQAVAVHYIPRQFRSLEVEPLNVWAGHAICNSKDQLESNNGEYHERYRQWLLDNPIVEDWGVKWLENRKRVMVKHGTHFYKNLIQELKNGST